MLTDRSVEKPGIPGQPVARPAVRRRARREEEETEVALLLRHSDAAAPGTATWQTRRTPPTWRPMTRSGDQPIHGSCRSLAAQEDESRRQKPQGVGRFPRSPRRRPLVRSSPVRCIFSNLALGWLTCVNDQRNAVAGPGPVTHSSVCRVAALTVCRFPHERSTTKVPRIPAGFLGGTSCVSSL